MWAQKWCQHVLTERVKLITLKRPSFLLLLSKSSKNITVWKNKYVLSHSFYGSGIWVWVSWVPLAQGLSWGCCQAVSWGCSHGLALPGEICLQVHPQGLKAGLPGYCGTRLTRLLKTRHQTSSRGNNRDGKRERKRQKIYTDQILMMSFEPLDQARPEDSYQIYFRIYLP